MNDIRMNSKWVNRNTGRWVIVVRTWGYPQESAVRIADSKGHAIILKNDEFLKTFVPVDDEARPYPGETWTTQDSFRHVKILTVSDGYVVYEANEYTSVSKLDDFLLDHTRGKHDRPLPEIDNTGYEAMWFPIQDGKINYSMCRWEQQATDPRYNSGEGWVRVPLAWDRAETR